MNTANRTPATRRSGSPMASGLGQRFSRLAGADVRNTPLPRRRPQVQLELNRGLPVWLVRVLAAALLLAAGALVATGPVQLVIAAGLAAGVVLSRTGVVSSLGIALVMVAYLVRRSPEGWLGVSPPLLTAALLLCLHACAYLTRRCSELAPGARAEFSALAAGAAPAAAIQVFSQVLNLLIGFVTRHGALDATVLAVLALAGLAVVGWLAARAIRAGENWR